MATPVNANTAMNASNNIQRNFFIFPSLTVIQQDDQFFRTVSITRGRRDCGHAAGVDLEAAWFKAFPAVLSLSRIVPFFKILILCAFLK